MLLCSERWMNCTCPWLLCAELIWVILQVEEGGVLAVTQLLSNFSADVAHVVSTPADNPFMSPPAPALPLIPDNTVISCNLPAAGSTTDVAPRHSSLPSSPRWFGESAATSTSPMLIPNEPLRARAVLFQVGMSCNRVCELECPILPCVFDVIVVLKFCSCGVALITLHSK